MVRNTNRRDGSVYCRKVKCVGLMMVNREKTAGRVQVLITKPVPMALVIACFTSYRGRIHHVGFYTHLVHICLRIEDTFSAIINVTIPSYMSDFVSSVLKQESSYFTIRALFQHQD